MLALSLSNLTQTVIAREDSPVEISGMLIRTPVLFHFDVCSLDDWCPTGNFALHQPGEWLLTSSRLGRNVGAKIDKAPAHALIIQCQVEGIGEFVADRLWHALRRKQRKPRRRLKFWQAGFY